MKNKSLKKQIHATICSFNKQKNERKFKIISLALRNWIYVMVYRCVGRILRVQIFIFAAARLSLLEWVGNELTISKVTLWLFLMWLRLQGHP